MEVIPDTEALCVFAAEKLGWLRASEDEAPHGIAWWAPGAKDCSYVIRPPDFAHSHDALVPLIEKIKAEKGDRYYAALDFAIVEMTPALAIASLRVSELWSLEELKVPTRALKALIDATPPQKLMACWIACQEIGE